MKKNRLKLILLIIILSTFILSGCQLAQRRYSTASNADQLCGLYVSIGGQSVEVNNQTFESNNIVYDQARNLTEDDYTHNKNPYDSISGNKIEGTISDDGIASFEGIDGYYMGLIEELDDKGNVTGQSMGSIGFSNQKNSIKDIDNIREDSYEATFTVSSKLHDLIDIDPIYKRDDGTYYLVTDQNAGFMTSGSTGDMFSQTLTSSHTYTEGKIKRSVKISLTINIAVADETQKLLIKEMDQHDKLIKTTQYKSNVPDTYVVDSKTTYVVVEENKNNNERGNEIVRSIYTPERKDTNNDESIHTCSFADKDGVIEQKNLQFIYK